MKNLSIKKYTLCLLASFVGMSAWSTPDPRLNAKPGECFAQVKKDAVLRTVQEKVLVSPEQVFEEPVMSAPQYEEKTLVVTPERIEKRYVPAQYKYLTKKIKVSDAEKEEYLIPAKYQIRNERVQVSSGEKKWIKKKTGQNNGFDAFCLEESTPKFENVQKKIKVQDEKVAYRMIPAQYTTVRKKVLAKKGFYQKVRIPAVTKKVRVKLPSRGLASKKRIVPAKYKLLTKTQVVQPASQRWAKIICEQNATPALVSKIQEQLKKRGLIKHVSGRLDTKTYNAVVQFQKNNNIEYGAITMETLKLLNVNSTFLASN